MKKWKCLLSVLSLLLIFGAGRASAAVLQKDGKDIIGIIAEEMKTGDEDISAFPEYSVSYSRAEEDIREVNFVNTYGAVVPVTVPKKGHLYVKITGVPQFSYEAKVRLYKDAACTQMVNYSGYNISSASDRIVMKMNCPAEGTYYVGFMSSGQNAFTANSFKFRAYFYSTADRTMSNKTWTVSGEYDGSNRYYKITLKKNGYILVESDQEILYYSAFCDSHKKVMYDRLNWDKQNKKKISMYLPKGTYYVLTKGSDQAYKLRYTFSDLGSSAYTIRNKKKITFYPGSEKILHYIKYKAGVNGYVTFTASSENVSQLTLCNSSLKAISPEENFSKNTKLLYGVKKGTTYYLKVSGAYHIVTIQAKESAVSEKSGASRKKAVAVKSGKTVKGVLQAGNKTDDWYKITLKKWQKVTFSLTARTNAFLRMELVAADRKTCVDTKIFGDGDPVKLKSTLKKGTYYIRIFRGEKNVSGYYTLKWK